MERPGPDVRERQREAAAGPRHAIIGPRAGHAELVAAVERACPAVLDGRLEVLSVEQAKGLEFDAVVVLDPVAIVAASTRGANDLYVALTRPTQRLTVLHHGELPAGMQT